MGTTALAGPTSSTLDAPPTAGRATSRGILAACLCLLLALASGAAGSPTPGAGLHPVATAAGAQPPAAQDSGLTELGTLRWRFDAGGPLRAAPVLHGRTLYQGGTDGRLHALDADSGAPGWSFDAGAPIVAPVAVDEERVYLFDRHGTVHALERADARVAWRVRTGPELPLPWGYEGWDYTEPRPVLAGDTLLVAAGDGNLYALDRGSGAERWRFEAGAPLRAAPTVVDRTVYFGDGAGIFRAVDLDGGTRLWRFETDGHTMDSASSGFDRRQIYSRAAVWGDTVYFGSRDANVYALDALTGRLRWKANDGTSAWVMAGPTVADGRVYVTRSSSRRVRALDPRTGTEIWGMQASGAIFTAAVRTGDILLVGDGAGLLRGLDPATGAERWRYGLGRGIWGTPLVVGDRLWVGSDDGRLYAFASREGPTPRLAVFLDERLAARGSVPADTGTVVDGYFARRGYEALDADELVDFLRTRLDDSVPSAIVFAVDALPEPVVAPAAEGSLLRRYLEAGGTIAWIGFPPLIREFDDRDVAVALDRGAPERLLDLDFSAFNADIHPAFPTATGLRMGLETPWLRSPSIVADGDTIVLGTDDLGRPAAWLRRFAGHGGFLYLYPARHEGRLDEIRSVVEYELYRSPPTPEDDDRRDRLE